MKSGAWKIAVVIVLVAAVAIVLANKKKSVERTAPLQQTTVSGKNLPKMLELGSTTCMPCKMMEKVIEELRRDYSDSLAVEFINTEEQPDMATKYKIKVIPTQVFLDPQGNEFYRHLGFYPTDDIIAMLRDKGYRIQKRQNGGNGTE